jgi:hypothetical protein
MFFIEIFWFIFFLSNFQSNFQDILDASKEEDMNEHRLC